MLSRRILSRTLTSCRSVSLSHPPPVSAPPLSAQSSQRLLPSPSSRLLSTSPMVSREERLFAEIDVELRAHQPAVLKSYAWFMGEAAKHLDVTVVQSEGEEEPYRIRKTLLRSNFVHSKARTQYEMKTYYWLIRLEKLTESTRDTYLEYVQRNLPEGVAMKVTEKELCRLPKAIREDIQKREREEQK